MRQHLKLTYSESSYDLNDFIFSSFEYKSYAPNVYT